MPAKSWDSYRDTLYRILEEFEPRAALEWGPGHSTDIIANFRSLERVVSIEHDPIYFEKMRTRIYPELSLYLEPDFERYVALPAKRGLGPFDLIFVDGRNRARCLQEAQKLLAIGGIVIVHDADREDYQSAIAEYPFAVFTDGGSTAVLTLSKESFIKTKEVLKGLELKPAKA